MAENEQEGVRIGSSQLEEGDSCHQCRTGVYEKREDDDGSRFVCQECGHIVGSRSITPG